MVAKRCMVFLAGYAAAQIGLVAFAQSADDSGMIARQLYYKKKSASAAKPKAAVSKGGTGHTKAEPTSPAAGVPEPSGVAATTTPTAESDTAPTASAQHLGLRYSIVDAKTSAALDPAKVFRTGDQIRVRIESNTAGYLYVINKDPHGEWTALFPSAEVVNNDNHIREGGVAEIPAEQSLDFAGDTGTETLYVVLSKAREPNMENLIEMLRDSRSVGGKRDDRLMLAQNRMADIQKQSDTMRARAIKVGAVRSEKAVYVAAAQPDTTRIVTAIVLEHR